MDPKQVLHTYLRNHRDQLLAKLDGLGEYDVRRPLVDSGTNLLGLVKHVASVELGYFSTVFGQFSELIVPWFDEDAEPGADMWATADESREQIVAFRNAVAAHADAVIDGLPLDTPGRVPWWPPERAAVTLQQILVHMVAETARHAGHADIIRELIDGSLGTRPNDPNVPERSHQDWRAWRDRIEQAARAADERGSAPDGS